MLATKEGLYTREDFADELEHGGGRSPLPPYWPRPTGSPSCAPWRLTARHTTARTMTGKCSARWPRRAHGFW